MKQHVVHGRPHVAHEVTAAIERRPRGSAAWEYEEILQALRVTAAIERRPRGSFSLAYNHADLSLALSPPPSSGGPVEA